MNRPRIGVTGARRRGRLLWLGAAVSLLIHGARPVRITAPFHREDFAKLDGLIIGGGDDIGATLYGAEPIPDIRIDAERDAMELDALSLLWDTEIPILGICRGSQMLNIFLGGRLHQDIYTVYDSAPKMRTALPRKTVTLEAGTKLARIIDKPTITVNSLHHQSVDHPGEGLRIAGRDEYGIVQAVEHITCPFRLGVQWHPELLFYRHAHRQLFRAFVEAAKAARPADV